MRWPLFLPAALAAAVRLDAGRGQPAAGGSGLQREGKVATSASHRRHHHGRRGAGKAKASGGGKSGGGGEAGTWRGPLWFFAAHHKAGTNLLHGLATVQAHAMGLQLCTGTCGLNVLFGKQCEMVDGRVSERNMFYCNTGAGDLEAARKMAEGRLRGVQVVRDPAQLVVSGYVYDMHANDGFHASRSMRGMDAVSGLQLEAEFALKSVLPGMLAVYRSGREHRDVLVVRMEDFTASSKSFDETVSRLYNYTLGDFASKELLEHVRTLAMQEDLRRHPELAQGGGVSPIELKRKAEKALEGLPAGMLATLRKYSRELGY